MNDEKTNQLCEGWQIPPYLQGKLYVSTPHESVKVEGKTGEFALQTPSDTLTLRVGAEDGVPLTQLRWRADSLGWRGEIRLGGMVDALHMVGANTDSPIGIAITTVQPLYPTAHPLKLDSRQLPIALDYLASLDREEPLHTVTWAMSYDSPLFAMVQDAMSNKLTVFFFGQVYTQKQMQDGRGIFPLALEALTLFQT